MCAELWGENRKIEMANGLMAVMAVETGKTFKAHMIEGLSLKDKSKIKVTDFYKEVNDLDKNGKIQKNKDGSIKKKRSSRAVGLIQFTQAPLTDFGKFKTGSGFDALDKVKFEFSQMSELEQLDWVKKYFQLGNAYSKIKIPEDIYSLVFAPKLLGKSLDEVIYKEGTVEYTSNASIDTNDGNNDGKIQKKELIKRYYDKYREGKQYVNIFTCEDDFQLTNSNNSNGWHDPVTNPQINRYNYGGAIKPSSACFGNTRNSGARFHTGADLFAIPEITKVYACLDCKLVSFGTSTINLEIIDTKQLIDQMKSVNYNLIYDNEYLAGISTPNVKKFTGKESKFILKETDRIKLRYVHLHTKFPKKQIVDNNGIIKAGTAIGYAGVEGNADMTKAPHLHFEVVNISAGNILLNPLLFIKLHSFKTKEQNEAKEKEWRDKAHKHLQK